jgi:serine/threonine protein kinase
MTLRFIGEGRVGQGNVIARIPLHRAAVDVLSLGVIFFYMLSGYHPFSDALSTSENAIVRGLLLVQFVFFSYSQYSLLAFFPGHFRLEKN